MISGAKRFGMVGKSPSDDQPWAMIASLTVTIKLFAIYQEAYGQTEIQRTFPPGTAIATVLEQILQEKPQLAPWQTITRFGCNHQFVPGETLLKDGDEIVLIPPVSGG